MSVKLNTKGKSHANSLIDSGNVDKTSAWSFSAEDGNKLLGDPPDWDKYSSFHLGIDTDATKETKAYYKYPYGKDGKVFRSGVIAAKQRAAQQGETDIENAAGALLEKIDGAKALSWYEIKNKVDKSEIWIYEEIGEDGWSGGGITAKGFQKELSAIKSSQIDLHINSPGGLVFDGITIYNLIKQHPANVTTYIDGLAASISSVIALAGDKVIMAENALFMIHKASGMVMGNSDDMRDFADKLDKVNGAIANTYISKTGKDDTEINDMMKAETWLTADEALACGFIDEISGEVDMAACAKFVPTMLKAGFQHIPQKINITNKVPTAKETEKALRDAGHSRKQAKEIMAKGFSGDLCDADEQELPKVQRYVELKKKDRISDLLTRAEIIAPSI
jgi:ATP-dependent Clp endopeptidase proteolytic subunit ClpP